MQVEPVRCAQGRELALGFLHPVFPEHGLPGFQRFQDSLDRLGLGYRDQGHVARLPPGCDGRVRNAVLNAA